MNKDILEKHIRHFLAEIKKDPERFENDAKERLDLVLYYQSYSAERILAMTGIDIYEYIAKLWAMRVWGNKNYVVDKLIEENGLGHFRKSLSDLVWGKLPIAERWDEFRKGIKGMGPAMMSEILCKTHPDEYLLWNRKAYVGLSYLDVKDLPRYDYQITGKVYSELCEIGHEIAGSLKQAGHDDYDLLAVDYFIWEELQVEREPEPKPDKKSKDQKKAETPEMLEFIHNDVRDKIREIGEWLGFKARTEQKVADGSKVDAIWEATIGNMGRVIYVFEVQTKGNVDSLILNLLKSLNNPAVQGVVAVSDEVQLREIEKEVQEVGNLNTKLKYWNYEDVLKVHESLAFVNENINTLRLVPEGFFV